MSKYIKFKILKFNKKDFVMWNAKIYVIIVNDGCIIALKERQSKLEGMTNVQFAEKDEIVEADILLALED